MGIRGGGRARGGGDLTRRLRRRRAPVEARALDDWRGQPSVGNFDAAEVLAFVASLAVLPAAERRLRERAIELRRGSRARLRAAVEAGRRQRREGDAPAPPVLAAGWRRSRVAWLALGALAFAAGGVWILTSAGEAVVTRVVVGGGCVACGIGLAGRLISQRLRSAVALRIDAAGIEIAGNGVVPWSAISRCSLERRGGNLTLVVDPSPTALDAPWMTPRMRRHGLALALGLIETDATELAATLAAYGARLRA